jgi:pimeloyl-ACP methyl ester carboxylesterase
VTFSRGPRADRHDRLAAQEDIVERFEHNGGSLVADVLGEATSRHIVFLHGWGGNRESLRGIATLFQHTHRVHLIDLPGFGDAPPPPESWSTIEYTDLVQNYILARVTGSVLLVGHSFGGRVSVRLAARHLPAIAGVVLMGVPGLPQPTWSRARWRRLGIRWLRKALIAAKPVAGDKPVQWHSRRFGSRDYQDAGVLRPVFVRVVNEDLTESAATIAVPTLLLWGTDDTESPVWMAERYYELMRGHAQLELLPHKDHHLYMGTGAHLCAYKIRNWADAHVHA